MLVVARPTGGLEIINLIISCCIIVARPTGGLETKFIAVCFLVSVARPTGGLENIDKIPLQVPHRCPPHRRLRNMKIGIVTVDNMLPAPQAA